MYEQGRGVLANLVWGIAWGLLLSCCLIVFVAVLFLFQGQQPFNAYQTTVRAVVVLYLVGGALGGLVVGVLRPLTKWRWGAAVVGVLAAVPVGLGTRVLRAGLSPWQSKDLVVLIVFCVALGAPVGWIYWRIFRES